MENINESSVAAGIGAFETIMSSIKNINDFIEKRRTKNPSNKLTSSSIMNASKDLVMSFPVICSTNITPKTALLIQRAIERNCLTTLQMLFAASALKGENGIDVIRKWHNNLKLDVTMDDYFNYIENVGAGIDRLIESAGENSFYNKYNQRMIDECKANNKYYIDTFSESSLLSYEISINKYTGKTDVNVVNEANGDMSRFRTIKGKKVVINPQTGREEVIYVDQNLIDAKNKDDANAIDYARFKNDVSMSLHQKEMDDKNYDLKSREVDIKGDDYQLRATDSKDQYIKRQLLDSDIKKANEMVPSMLVVRYNVASQSTEQFLKVDEFVAGVKARLIGSDSAEIIDRIRLAMDNKVDVKNFIRATTGEIRFCKDFILAIDAAKIEAKRNSKLSKTSPIWRALQNRSNRSNFKRIMKYNNTAAAITSLVISAEEVNRLSTQYNIDLLNVKKARDLMEAYNFMEIVIVDEALEVARFLLDNGDGYFQDYSFAALQKETSDTELRKAVNLMASMNR